MVTSYGSFPGVKVGVAGGGITAVSVGGEENLLIFGEASYQNDGDFSPGDGNPDPLIAEAAGSVNEPIQINARREADVAFGSDSELANGMRQALANGANIDFMSGVAPARENVVDEVHSTQTGTLTNAPLYEEDVADESNIETIVVVDDDDPGTELEVRYSYDDDLTAPGDAPADSDPAVPEIVAVNPLTGEYIADQSPVGDLLFSYKYLDWQAAFDSEPVTNVVNEDETGIYVSLSDSDAVSVIAEAAAGVRRNEFQLINAISGAQPNSSKLIESSNGDYVRRNARFDTANYSQGSVNSDYYFKLAPVRLPDSPKTIMGGVAGLFAGNPISDPIFNDAISGFSELEQQLTKTAADDLRDARAIPVKQAGSIRVKDNISTSTETDWQRDFFRRRIADRVVLIGKTVGDLIVGRINDQQTRDTAQRLIRRELRELSNDGLIRPNAGEEQNFFVDVFESSTNPDEVKIDIGFTPFGIVKRIDETITIDT